MSYTLDQNEYRRLKTRLTAKQNKFRKAQDAMKNEDDVSEAMKAAKAVVAERDYAVAIFEEKGYPDSHSNWERLGEDAHYFINRNASRNTSTAWR